MNQIDPREPPRAAAAWALFLWIALFLSGCRNPHLMDEARTANPLDDFRRDRPAAAAVLTTHPALERWIRAELSRSFTVSPLAWENQEPESGAAAEHVRRPGTPLIVLRVAASLEPEDQVLGFTFEAINARGLRSFQTLTLRAAAGKLSREQYIDEMLRIEFGTLRIVRDRFPQVCPLPPEALAHTRLYRHLLEAPADFDAFLAWRSQSIEGQRTRSRYGEYYDSLRRN